MGEPAGIGGEIALAAWAALRHRGPAFLLLDDPQRLVRLARQLGWDIPVLAVESAAETAAIFPEAVPVLPLTQPVPFAPGRLSGGTAGGVVESIDRAVRLTRDGLCSAVVTNPIHKGALTASGFAYPGHTEYLAALAGVERTVMLLTGGGLSVVPVTIHVALEAVPRLLTQERIVEAGRILAAALRDDFGIGRPRIAVAGLNPHAGEGGVMGREEIDVLAPALDALRREGILVSGPLAADTMFHARARATYDAALCMYHDQALIPLKTLAFDEGVNVTLGLPFVRTSPDHGTALDIAGQGVARADSLIAALHLAARLAARRMERTRA